MPSQPKTIRLCVRPSVKTGNALKYFIYDTSRKSKKCLVVDALGEEETSTECLVDAPLADAARPSPRRPQGLQGDKRNADDRGWMDARPGANRPLKFLVLAFRDL